jgi:hypothetical protein
MNSKLQTRRPRGRPKGTGTDDSVALRKIADLLVENPRLKPMTAMRQIAQPANDSNVHRLNRKWKRDGQKALAEAEERKRRKQIGQEVRAAARAASAIREGVVSLGKELFAFQVDPGMRVAFEQLRSFRIAPEVQAAFEQFRNFRIAPEIQAAFEKFRDLRISPELQVAFEQFRNLKINPRI